MQKTQRPWDNWESWHSVLRNIYHNNHRCEDGNNIEDRYVLQGPGIGKELCKRCRTLNLQDLLEI